jgi:hypothetical protein
MRETNPCVYLPFLQNKAYNYMVDENNFVTFTLLTNSTTG